jgi:hypothetical protein
MSFSRAPRIDSGKTNCLQHAARVSPIANLANMRQPCRVWRLLFLFGVRNFACNSTPWGTKIKNTLRANHIATQGGFAMSDRLVKRSSRPSCDFDVAPIKTHRIATFIVGGIGLLFSLAICHQVAAEPARFWISAESIVDGPPAGP